MLKGVSRLLLAAALLASVACSKAPTDDPTTLVINNSTEPQTLDPALEVPIDQWGEIPLGFQELGILQELGSSGHGARD